MIEYDKRDLASDLPHDMRQHPLLVKYLPVHQQLEVHLAKYEHLGAQESLEAIGEVIRACSLTHRQVD